MDHRPRRRCSMLASRYPMLISIIVKITAQCTSNFVDGKEWLPLPVLQGTPRTRPRRSVAARRLWPAAAPKARDTSGRRSKREKNEERKTKLGAAGLPIALVGRALFIVSVNSEACLNSEMNLWINTIMVIWHPLWMPLRVFVCPPAALEAGQTFLDLPLAVALDAARPGLGLWFAARCQFQFQFQPRLRSILPDNLLPSLCGRLV